MNKVRVIMWGLGNMGSGMAKALLERSGVEIVGAIGKNPTKIGKDLGETLGLSKIGVVISNDAADVLMNTQADVVLHSTDSFVKTVHEEIILCCDCGKNVITIAEEMAYPQGLDPELAARIDEAARANGVSVLGTGVNPGFMMDMLVAAVSGGCLRVDSVKAARINDLSPFGPTVMKTQGVGATVEEFNSGVAAGTIVGHIGFQQSARMIAEAIGWEISRIDETREPIISTVYRETPCVKVQPGMVAGCRHCAKAYDKAGKLIIELEHPQQIHPHLENVDTGDYIWVYGDPNMQFANKPECPGGKGTMATAINMIPQIINAQPGLKTMLDLPVISAIMGDYRVKINHGDAECCC